METSLSSIKGIKNAQKARNYLGLSLSELAAELSRLTGKTVFRQLVCHWEAGRRKPSADMLKAYGVLIANRLSDNLGRIVGVKMVVNSPWHVAAWTQCCDCGAWFELCHSLTKHCPRHRTS